MNIYSDIIIKNAHRILGLLDRNSYSKTYGCFDRQYWHYKVIDFPCARMQEAALTMALLYKNKYKNNIFYKKEKIKNFSLAAINFWCNIQNRNGSFNEWYPNENSFVATAFSTYAISEACKLLKYEEANYNIEKAAKWLLKKNELLVSNQQSGACCALYNSYILTQKPIFKKYAKEKIDLLLKLQSDEGWFPEYGGADIGYLSVILYYLAKYYEITGDERVKKSATKAVNFLKYFIHPDFTIGGEYGSRNTEYILPYGLEVFSDNKKAVNIANVLIHKIKFYGTNLDDRYLCYNGYSYLEAQNKYKKRKMGLNFVFDKTFKKQFRDAGLFVISTKKYYIIVSLKKGVIKVFDKANKKIVYDYCGIIGETVSKKIITTQWLNIIDYKIKKNIINLKGNMVYANFIIPNTISTIFGRTFQNILGNVGFVSDILKSSLRKRLILQSKKSPVEFDIKLFISDSKITIISTIKSNNVKLSKLKIGGKFSVIYIPSSRYFEITELEETGKELTKNEIKELNKKGKLSYIKIIKPAR